MTFLSKKLSCIQPSPTLAMAQKARQLKQEGVDVISLSAGEPDFPIPESILKAAKDAMDQGFNTYTDVGGILDLKKAVAEKFQNTYGLSYTPKEIVITSGAKQALFNAILATVDAGDEVIIPAPYWVSYIDMVRISEGTPVVVPCPLEQGFKITPEQIRKVLTDQTKWIFLNSPQNPTGAVYTQQELEALAQVIRSHPTLHVISDDIYEPILYTSEPFKTMAQVAPDLKERILTVNGVSKAYSMTGWRLGYAAGPAFLIEAMTNLQSQSTSNANCIAQKAAIAALTGSQDFLKVRQEEFRKRRDKVVESLNAIPGIQCPVPDGAFYVFPKCTEFFGKTTPQGHVLKDDTALCAYLLEEAQVATVPGEAFGYPGHFRISYATELETLCRALTRLQKAFEKLL